MQKIHYDPIFYYKAKKKKEASINNKNSLKYLLRCFDTFFKMHRNTFQT